MTQIPANFNIVPGRTIRTKSQKSVFICICGHLKHYLIAFASPTVFVLKCISATRTIKKINYSTQITFSRERGMYKLIGCTNYQKFYGTFVCKLHEYIEHCELITILNMHYINTQIKPICIYLGKDHSFLKIAINSETSHKNLCRDGQLVQSVLHK